VTDRMVNYALCYGKGGFGEWFTQRPTLEEIQAQQPCHLPTWIERWTWQRGRFGDILVSRERVPGSECGARGGDHNDETNRRKGEEEAV
jgi:hypothetical protein